ncbi:MAG: bifunctional riboflavin kinase/FAD synthetase [Xanthomonadales bacterium]|nr:bifunctional riboflavin kinase/FAD synthetase [Xanthomonadales bacterium]
MQVITGNEWGAHAKSGVVTIGNFDGLHLGHMSLVQRCTGLREPGDQAAMVTFEPLPLAFFRPEAAPARLSSARQKLELMESAGMDLVWLMEFNQELARMKAGEFANRVLAVGLGAKTVVVGADFRFGYRREGDIGQLQSLGNTLGFAVEVVEDYRLEGQRVSSSAARQALAKGDFDLAARLLGRPFTMCGTVIEGQKLGRKLGYPTANMALEASPSPLHGVFAVRARVLHGGAWLDGIANLGVRPAVGGSEFLVEVHIFDQDLDLYGHNLEVEFVGMIREEADFDELAELVEQMKADEIVARRMLAQGTA